jgi:2TM domain-containing protein
VDEHEKLERARQQVNVLLGFYIHLTVFVATMALLLVINFAVYYWANSVWWVQWPFLVWGIFVLAHALVAFRRRSTGPGFIKRWRLRKIQELKNRM